MKTEPKEFRDLIRCWQALPRSEGSAPLKSSFSPGSVLRLMPNLFLLERSGKHRICIRLIGSELEAVLGRKFLPVGSVFNTLLSEEWEYYEKLFDTCAQKLCAGRVSRTIRTKGGLMMDMDSLCVPLADEEGNPRFILGVVIMHSNRERSLKALNDEIPRDQILGQRYVDLGDGTPKHKLKFPTQKMSAYYSA